MLYLPHWVSTRRFRWFASLFLVSLGLVLAVGLVYLPSNSQSIRNARIIEIVENPETLKVSVNQTQAKIGDEVNLGQRVLTEQEARTGLRLTVSAGVRLAKNSSFTVGSECIQLEKGKALVAGTKGCIGSVIATNRGTIYVMERSSDQGTIKVLEGSVGVSNQANPPQTVTVNQGQKITVQTTGALGTVTPITRPEFEAILAGELFQGFNVPFPNETRLFAVLPQIPPAPPPAPPAPPAPSAPFAPTRASQPGAVSRRRVARSRPVSLRASSEPEFPQQRRVRRRRYPRRRYSIARRRAFSEPSYQASYSPVRRRRPRSETYEPPYESSANDLPYVDERVYPLAPPPYGGDGGDFPPPPPPVDPPPPPPPPDNGPRDIPDRDQGQTSPPSESSNERTERGFPRGTIRIPFPQIRRQPNREQYRNPQTVQ